MEINILSVLAKSINPNLVYEFEFIEGVLETKTGKDWIGHFTSARKQITNEDGYKLIEHFKSPEKESHNKPIKNKKEIKDGKL